MIRGLSYQNGVFYIGFKHIANARMKAGEIKATVQPLSLTSIMWMLREILFSIPLYYYISVFIVALIVVKPEWMTEIPFVKNVYIPWTLFLLGPTFAHFLFPARLKKFHGAEHKVFSYKGKVSIDKFHEIKAAEITNRYCSTNFVVAQLLVLIILLLCQLPLFWSAIGAFIGSIIVQQIKWKRVEKIILSISYPLQRWITTKEPEDNHINVAIQSYSALMAVKANRKS